MTNEQAHYLRPGQNVEYNDYLGLVISTGDVLTIHFEHHDEPTEVSFDQAAFLAELSLAPDTVFF